MKQKTYELNDVAEGLLNVTHALVAGLDETRLMPISTSAAFVRAWADCMDHVPAGVGLKRDGQRLPARPEPLCQRRRIELFQHQHGCTSLAE